MRAFSQSTEKTALTSNAISWVLLAGFFAIAFSYITLLTLDSGVAQMLAKEGSLIENAGAAFLLLASIFFATCYQRSGIEENWFVGCRTKRNVWFLLLALLMLLSLGEELSWGQGLFGWSTPPALWNLNAQHETNLHNLWIFEAHNPDGTPKTFLELLLNSNRLLSIFWLTYCVAIPLLVTLSHTARSLTQFFGFPIPCFGAGALFITNFVVFRVIATYGMLDRKTLSAFDELKETNYELAFMVLAFCFTAVARPARRSGLLKNQRA